MEMLLGKGRTIQELLRQFKDDSLNSAIVVFRQLRIYLEHLEFMILQTFYQNNGFPLKMKILFIFLNNFFPFIVSA